MSKTGIKVGRTVLRVLTMGLAPLLLLCACERRPLEVMINPDVDVQLIVDWRVNYGEIYHEIPNGMTVLVWDSDGRLVKAESVNSDRVTLSLPTGDYRLIIHNETPQEFLYQSFFDYYDYDNIVMRAVHYNTTDTWDSGIDYMQYPDPTGVTASQFVITDDMVDGDSIIFAWYEEWKDLGTDYYKPPTKMYTLHEVAWPMTVNLDIKALVKRPQGISTIEGSISGMAEGFYLSRVNRTSESGTLRLVDDNTLGWRLEGYGEKQDSTGYIRFTIPTFGLPYGKELLEQRQEADNVLTLNFTLTDGTVIKKAFDVGRQIRYITPEGREAEIRYRQDLNNLALVLDLSEEIILPPSQSQEAGGFDAKVDQWDEDEVDIGGF